MTPNDLIASAISRERERAGISLSALATKAGLAKSTISQLEAGNGNPSIETLWAIAAALDVPFSFLFENTVPQSQVIRVDEGDQLSSDHSAFSAVLLAKCAPTNRRDLYRVSVTKGAARAAEPHPAGTVEHVIVCDGTVRVGPTGRAEELVTGDYYRYPSNVPHSYEAISDKATLLLVMESSR